MGTLNIKLMMSFTGAFCAEYSWPPGSALIPPPRPSGFAA
jgi:hypothetical protein